MHSQRLQVHAGYVGLTAQRRALEIKQARSRRAEDHDLIGENAGVEVFTENICRRDHTEIALLPFGEAREANPEAAATVRGHDHPPQPALHHHLTDAAFVDTHQLPARTQRDPQGFQRQ
ncbi:MAG: Uncharacterised protein [Rhodospirillaceae bacterium]|nr:MAG: Uncharacterised protein [Rhodospirillaceae bacterium]